MDVDDDAISPLLAAGRRGKRSGGGDDDDDAATAAAANGGVPAPKLYSPFACLAFTVNYIVGVGVAGLPRAFYDAGWALGLIILLVVTVVSYMSMIWLLEVMVRAEALTQLEEVHLEPLTSALNGGGANGVGSGKQYDDDDDAEDDADKPGAEAYGENKSWLSRWFRPTAFRSLYTGMASPHDLDPRMAITTRKFEVNQLVASFLGVAPQRMYEAFVLMYLFGTLWGFTAIAGTTLGATVPFIGISADVWPCDYYPEDNVPVKPECLVSYKLYVLFFAVFMIPMCLMDLSEQTFVQIFMCIYRFLAIFVMSITSAVGLALQPYPIPGDTEPPAVTEPPYIGGNVGAFKVQSFAIIFSTTVFAQLTHHSIPGLAQPINDKRKLNGVFFWSLTITLFLYAMMGCILSVYLGDQTNDLVTLNWSPANFGRTLQWWEQIISYFVVILPIFLASSAFPLTAITFGNNLLAALPPRWTDNGRSKRARMITRLIAAVPPLVLGTFIYELSIVISVTGLAGAFIAFIFPPVMQYASRKRVAQIAGGDVKTPYTTVLSHPILLVLVFLFGFGALGIMLADILGLL